MLRTQKNRVKGGRRLASRLIVLPGSSSLTCFRNLFKGLDVDLIESSNDKFDRKNGIDKYRALHPTKHGCRTQVILGVSPSTFNRASHPMKLGCRTQVVLGISPSTFKQTSYGGIGENATTLYHFITQISFHFILYKEGFWALFIPSLQVERWVEIQIQNKRRGNYNYGFGIGAMGKGREFFER